MAAVTDAMDTDQDFLVRTLGVTQEEAFLLLRVLARGHMTAAAAARIMAKSRGRAYEMLRSLASAGLLDERPGRPLVFHPRPLKDAVTGKRAELESRLAALRQAEQALKQPAPALPVDPGSAVSMFWGIQAINREASRMAQASAKAFVAAGTSSFGADAEGFDLLLVAMAEARLRGVDVHFYMADRPETAKFRQQVDRALGPGHLVTHDPRRLPDLAWFVSDGEVLQALPGSHGADEEADDAMGVKVRGALLPQFVRSSIQALVGTPGAQSVDEAFAEFKALVARARREISTLAGQGWRGLRPQADLQDLDRLYREAEARGVAIRTVMHDDEHALGLEGGVGQTRIHLLAPMWLAVVDDGTVFQVLRDEGGQVTARLSADATVVRLFRALFEHSWMDARPLEPQEVPDGAVGSRSTRVRPAEDKPLPAP